MAAPRESEGQPRSSGSKGRLRRREIARQRARRQTLLIWAAVAAAIVVAAIALAALARPGTPPASSPNNPGPVTSNEPMHLHVQLALFRDTTKATLPEDIGRNPARWVDHTLDQYLDPNHGAQGSLSPLHTHDTSGTIHVEASVTRAFTLGEFFAVWGQPLGPQRTVDLVPDANHTLTMTVDGVASQAWGNLVLADNQQVEVHYDTIL